MKVFKMYLFFLCVFILSCNAYTPIVLWHGMGDSCCSDGSLGKIITLLEDQLPSVTVLSLKFGNSTIGDIESGYFANANDQVAKACDDIAAIPGIQETGYNAVGFSQGAQFLRAVAQRCPTPRMKTLISLGGQHQGVYGLPRCAQPEPKWCDNIRKLLNNEAYVGWVQDSLIQAQYWHDPLDEELYRNNSIFLADINNERTEKNNTYAKNLSQLEKLVLVLFSEDSMVAPRESSWFGFYAPGQSDQVLDMRQTPIYTEDWIGLKALDNENKLILISTEGDHLQFTEQWFLDKIVTPYLTN